MISVKSFFALLTLCQLILFCNSIPVVRWFHGINDRCSDIESTLRYLFPRSDAICIETTRGQLLSFDLQIKIGCDYLNAEIDKLKDGFTLVGMSQGGLILQRCEAGKYVKRLLTMGTPNNGVAIIPSTDSQNPINTVILPLCFTKFFKYIVGPCNYIRSTKYYDRYMNSYSVILDLNNEKNENEDYKNRIRQLEMFMTVQFTQDKMVQPGSSSVFGFYSDDSYSTHSEMEDEDVYKKDRLSLKELENSGRFFRCKIDNQHMHVEMYYYEQYIRNFADTTKKDWLDNLETLRKLCRFKELIEM